MKTILILFTFISTSSFAGQFKDSFLKKTIVPEALQDELILASFQKFGCVDSLYEIKTTKNEIRIDQGLIDTYYTSVFEARFIFDGQHPTSTYITVESFESSFSNGKNTIVLDVQSSNGDYICP